ncbi:hypothetical protein KKA03_00490 [archaeon]|nr:hypothetical protein [archaeon]
MKKNILAIINELGLATAPEIESVLKELHGEVKKRTLFSNLKILEEGKMIFKLLQEENPYGVEGYLPGPNMETEDGFDIKKIVVRLGLQARDVHGVEWGLFSERVLDALMNEISALQEDLEKGYDDPKNIEMRYFDLSIEYHEFYGFFFDRYDTGFLDPVVEMLNECKSMINKKEM